MGKVQKPFGLVGAMKRNQKPSTQVSKSEQPEICGLCSQIVDESVLLNPGLKSFLLEILKISIYSLPDKTCLDCFKSANECKRFIEACKNSIRKLEQKKSPLAILGKSKGPNIIQTGENGTKSKLVSNAMKKLRPIKLENI